MKKVLIFCIACCVLLVTLFGGFYIHSQSAEAQYIGNATTDSSLNTVYVLKKSQTAMAHLHSVHFVLNGLTQSQQPVGNASAALFSVLQPLPSGTGAIKVTGSGDVVAPDQSRIDMNIDPVSGSGGSSFHEVVKKDNVYLSGQAITPTIWYRISKENLLASAVDNFTGADYLQVGMPQVSAMIALSLRKGTLSDEGNTTLHGKQLRHIHVSFPQDAFKDLQAINIENHTFPGGIPMVPKTGAADFLIDVHTGYVYQASTLMKFVATFGLEGTQTLQLQCSAFNQPVSITVPDHSTLITNLNQIPMSPIYPEP